MGIPQISAKMQLYMATIVLPRVLRAFDSKSKVLFSPARVDQLVGVLSHTAKDGRFDSHSEHIPRLHV